MRKRWRDRAEPLLDSASHYTEMRYGLRLRTVVGFVTALVAVVAWPVVRRIRKGGRDG